MEQKLDAPRIPVILKGIRESEDSRLCIKNWIQLFSSQPQHYSIYFLTENVSVMHYVKSIKSDVNICQTPKSIRDFLRNKVSSFEWVNNAASHLTCYQIALSTQSNYFWAIDADDMMLLGFSDFILKKLQVVEKIAESGNLDGISADIYYSIYNKHWSFGISFLRNNGNRIAQLISQNNLNEISCRLKERGLNERLISIDQHFDFLRDKEILNLRSFVIDGIYLIHPHNSVPALYKCIYRWTDGKFWDHPLDNDVVIV
jgi:hypothetical protein